MKAKNERNATHGNHPFVGAMASARASPTGWAQRPTPWMLRDGKKGYIKVANGQKEQWYVVGEIVREYCLVGAF